MSRIPKKEAQVVEVVTEYKMQEVHFNLLGSNLIMHRFSQKAWQELLFPSIKTNRASLEQSLKHDPWNEYRGAMYRSRDNDAPTLVHLPNGAIHGAMASAAIDIPGVSKAKIERLTRCTDITIDLYGVPQIFCSMVRNSDQNRTPDVRTRPIFREWACKVTFLYAKQIVTERTVANLLGAAGWFIGIGDWRPQKGGPYGTFRVVGDNDKDFKAVVAKQGRLAQQKAWDNPVFYDLDTEELLTWFSQEVRRREMQGQLNDDDELEPIGGRRLILEQGGNSKQAGLYVGEERS